MKERILQIMKQEGLTSSGFAEEIGIQRAAMSHITSGRNNPSLDVYRKILERFTYINPDWLLSGNGNMHRESSRQAGLPKQPDLFASPSDIPAEKKNIPEYRRENRDTKPLLTPEKPDNEIVISTKLAAKKEIKIVIFYSDNTYETFNPSS
jgi:transcriptional regulator with XRE-family HTH domain